MEQIEAYCTVPEYLEEDFNNILYVDDEESNLRVFDSVFSRYFNIYTANNGETAIEMLREHKMHMIITDQKMPEMTGTDLLEKTLEEFPDIIRIILTGFADIQAIIKAINKCSIYKYITKPYENSEMKAIIDKGLEIYNMRMKKYKVPNKELLDTETGDVALETIITNGHVTSKDLEVVAPQMVADLLPNNELYECYLDFHIAYQMPCEGYKEIYSDFLIFNDEHGSKLYHITMKTSPDVRGAMAYMHMKAKVRTFLETEGINGDLFELIDVLSFAYHGQEEDISFEPYDIKIITYNWEDKKLQYLTRQNNMKLFSIGHQLDPLKMTKSRKKHGDHALYSVSCEQDIIVYFWDYKLSPEGNEEDASEYFKQIVDNATSTPFDSQHDQVAGGIKSISKNLQDGVLFALYLNE